MTSVDELERRVGKKWVAAAAARMPQWDCSDDNSVGVLDWLPDELPIPADVPQFPREQWASYPNKRTVALLTVDHMLDLDLTDEQWLQVCFIMQYGGKTRLS